MDPPDRWNGKMGTRPSLNSDEPAILPEVDSWADLAQLLSGFEPDRVPPLVAARELEPIYPMLHALTRGSLGHFFLRIAALEALVEDSRTVA